MVTKVTELKNIIYLRLAHIIIKNTLEINGDILSLFAY